MIFFFKKNKIVVDCFTANSGVQQLYPIASANKFYPEGWKKHPAYIKQKIYPGNPESSLTVDAPTIKKCPGFIDLFNNGFIIPSWSDFGVEINSRGEFLHHTAGELKIEKHASWQIWDGLYSDYGHIKIGSPWC